MQIKTPPITGFLLRDQRLSNCNHALGAKREGLKEFHIDTPEKQKLVKQEHELVTRFKATIDKYWGKETD